MTAAEDPQDRNSQDSDLQNSDLHEGELRELESALGRLLASSTAPLNDVTTARVVRSVLRRTERRRQRRAGLVLLAAAAAVLLWLGKPRLPVEAPSPSAPDTLVATTTEPAVDGPTWEDPWEEELADAQEQVRELEMDWSRDADQFTHLSERLQALEAEWSASPL